MNEIKPLLTLTDAAANRVKNLMNDANSEVIGLIFQCCTLYLMDLNLYF